MCIRTCETKGKSHRESCLLDEESRIVSKLHTFAFYVTTVLVFVRAFRATVYNFELENKLKQLPNQIQNVLMTSRQNSGHPTAPTHTRPPTDPSAHPPPFRSGFFHSTIFSLLHFSRFFAIRPSVWGPDATPSSKLFIAANPDNGHPTTHRPTHKRTLTVRGGRRSLCQFVKQSLNRVFFPTVESFFVRDPYTSPPPRTYQWKMYA